MTKPFLPLTNEAFCDLYERDPQKAIAYIHGALQAGEREAGRQATQLLVYLQLGLIFSVVSAKTPTNQVDEVADGAMVEAVAAVLKNPPELVNLKQFRGWLATIAANHAAGITRSGAEQARRSSQSLDYEPADGRKSHEPSAEEDRYEAVGDREIFEAQLELLSEEHQAIILLRLLGDNSSKQVVEIVSSEHGWDYSANNVDQITRRFRGECKKAAKEQ
jgi:DNA-directed RNA polymerase specialized sigma24 family protein